MEKTTQGFRCDNCGLEAEGEPKVVVQDRADCSFGEVAVCPDCGSDDIEIGLLRARMSEKKQISDKQAESYLNGNWSTCPSCGSFQIEGQEVDIDSGYASQTCVCFDCDLVLKYIYKLVSIEVIE